MSLSYFTLMSTSQLHDDLRKRIQEKHRAWIRDSFALYDMADLSKHHATGDIIATMLSSLSAAFTAYEFSDEQATRVLMHWMAHQRRGEEMGN